MAVYTNLPVFKDTYALLLDVQRMVSHFPRDVRYTLVQELTSMLMNQLELVYDANSTRTKLPIIAQMRRGVVRYQVIIRLLYDMKHISAGKYKQWAESVDHIGKQLVAWQKYEHKLYGEIHPDQNIDG